MGGHPNGNPSSVKDGTTAGLASARSTRRPTAAGDCASQRASIFHETAASTATIATSATVHHSKGLRSQEVDRRASSRHASRSVPASVRGRKRHRLLPRRALAGSSQVAART